MNVSSYGKWICQGATEKEVAPQPPPIDGIRLRLFCIPMAGMGGWCYHGWTHGLPRDVEVMPVELPCRNTRIAEPLPYAASLPELARAILDGLGCELLKERPFVFFGHSFGSWLVHEVCLELSRRSKSDGWPLPLKIYVSGSRAPQLAGAANDADINHPTLSNLVGDDFWNAFENRYGKNPDLQAGFIKDMVEPLLRADFGLLESYEPSSADALDVNLCALAAQGDSRLLSGQLSAWSQCVTPGKFQERWFTNVRKPGNWATEHRYIIDNPSSLLNFLHLDLPIVGQLREGDFDIGMPAKNMIKPIGEETDEHDKKAGCTLL